VFHILLSLADGEKHGYSIMQEVIQVSNGTVKMGPGTLYGSIKRMLESALIRETAERPDPALDDERRRYYELTEFGRRVLGAELRRMESLLSIARTKKRSADYPNVSLVPSTPRNAPKKTDKTFTKYSRIHA
jgi:DNA-binding PadR family transcriptional regulator